MGDTRAEDRAKEICISSSDKPRVSRMQIASTSSVKRTTPPKRKYAPYADLARKIEVAKATSQFAS
jgi:hypothetical protein